MKRPLLQFLSLVSFAGFLGGCATEGVSPAEKKPALAADQTDVVMPAGSHIRVHVPKGQKAVSLAPTESATGEQLNDALITGDNNAPAEKPPGKP